MSGERDLARLLAGMNARRNDGVYLFCSVKAGAIDPDVRPLATFEEAEGLTLVLEEEEAKLHGLGGDFRAAWITLEIHSDLAAVGFLARVATALAAAGIPCNPISAYRHDHLFVPVESGEDAIRVLEELQASVSS